MQDLPHALGDPVTRGWYLVFCFALLVPPMIALSFCSRGIGQTAGGRALTKRQGDCRSARTAASAMPREAKLPRSVALRRRSLPINL
jgi:hypothetical protein